MSAKLIGELAEWLQSPIAHDLTSAERNILWTVAERTEEHGRKMLRHRTDDQPLIDRISRACGLSIETGALRKAFQRLAKRGLEVRVPTGTDKAGRPVYACEGRSMAFRLPEFPASYRIPERGESVPSSEAERRDDVPPSWPPAPVDNPARTDLSPAAEGRFSSPLSAQRREHSPERGEPVPERREHVPPLSPSVPSSPSTTKTFPSDGLRSSVAELEVPTGTPQTPPTTHQDQYLRAMGILTSLPDAGAFLLALAATELPAARREDQIIHAATLTDRIPA